MATNIYTLTVNESPNHKQLEKMLKGLSVFDLYYSLPFLTKLFCFRDLSEPDGKSKRLFLRRLDKLSSKNLALFQLLHTVVCSAEVRSNPPFARAINRLLLAKFPRACFLRALSTLSLFFDVETLPDNALADVFVPHLATDRVFSDRSFSSLKSARLSLVALQTLSADKHSKRVLARFDDGSTSPFVLFESPDPSFVAGLPHLFFYCNALFHTVAVSSPKLIRPVVCTPRTAQLTERLVVRTASSVIRPLAELDPEHFWAQPFAVQETFLETALGAYLLCYALRLVDNLAVTDCWEVLLCDVPSPFCNGPFLCPGKVPIARTFRVCVSEDWEVFKASFLHYLRVLQTNFDGLVFLVKVLFLGARNDKDWLAVIARRLFVGKPLPEKEVLDMLDAAVNAKKTKLRNYLAGFVEHD